MDASWIDFSVTPWEMSKEVPQEIINFIEDWKDKTPTIQLQTSGTTSEPKIYQAPKKYLIESAKMTQEFFGYEKGDKALLGLSIDYIAGKMMVIRAMVSGLKLTINPPNNLHSLTSGENFDFCPLVPLQANKYRAYLRQINTLLLGGAPVSEAEENEFCQFGNKVFHSFGMTETYSHFAIRDLSSLDKEYKLLKGVEMDEINQPEGRLIISIPRLGVKNLKTSDLVKPTTSGFVWLGRADFVINSGGIKIHPEQLEKEIQDCLQIKNNFIVTGLPDTKLGQKVVLVIEGETENIQKEEFSIYNSYHTPKEIIWVKEFPKTKVSEKIQRSKTEIIFSENNIIRKKEL
jgi:O-succinylbenzoic acid--CoA ligase